VQLNRPCHWEKFPMTSGKPTRHPTFPFDACSLIHIQIAFSYPSTLLTYLLGDKRKVDLYNPPTIHSAIRTIHPPSHTLIHSLIRSYRHAVKRTKFLFVSFFIHWASSRLSFQWAWTEANRAKNVGNPKWGNRESQSGRTSAGSTKPLGHVTPQSILMTMFYSLHTFRY